MATEQVVLQAPDISCAHCVKTIEKAVGALPGVQSVKAAVESKQVTVLFDPQQVNVDSVKAALEAEGYPAEAGAPPT